MSTIAPFNAAQPAFLLLTVIFIVKATPALSLLISLVTREEGVLVGNGPAVSDGEVVQLPSVVPVVAVLVEPVAVVTPTVSLLQEMASGTIVPIPSAVMNPFLKKSFLSMISINKF
jgi:hypothetical protein